MGVVELIAALPIEEDAKLMMQLRNDEKALKFSLHPEKKQWPDYFIEYIESLHTALYFIGFDGRRVGYVSLRPFSERVYEVSIAIDEKFRGKGLAKEALSKIVEIARIRGARALKARIDRRNSESLALFKGAGFRLERDGEPPVFTLSLNEQSALFIIAEAGSNWVAETASKSLARAFQMIESAKESGADAVKFQMFRASSTYAHGAGDYQGDDIEQLFRELELSKEMLAKLADYAMQWEIEFLTSIFSKEDFLAVDPHVKRHKIASYELSHFPLLDLVAASGKPLILSTGTSTIDEIRSSVRYFEKHGGTSLNLMQCTAAYPAPLAQMNLNAIAVLKETFSLPVGLSDHSREIFIAPLVALGKGATLFEKHFTLSRNLKGPDHPFSLEVKELKKLCKVLREGYAALGSGEKVVLPAEEKLFHFAKRRVQATCDIAAGEEILLDKNVALLRPGNQLKGAAPEDLEKLLRKRANREIKWGEGVRVCDVEASD